MVGILGCGEIADHEVSLLKYMGFKARKVMFPGEDHALVEVMVDGEWMVSDPGYEMYLISRGERAEKRIKEVGCLSYVCAVENGSNLELTEFYVPYDIFVIRVFKNGKPLQGAHVELRHKFRNNILKIPCVPLVTNSSGEVVPKIGVIRYNQRFQPSEDFYRIFVDGKDTGIKIISSGTGKVHYIRVDIKS